MPIRGNTVKSVSASYTAETFDDLIEVDASGGARTITLPTPNMQYGAEFTVTKTDTSANAVTISVAGSGNTINGAASYLLTAQHQSVRLVRSSDTNYRTTGGGSGTAASTTLTSATTIALDATANTTFKLTPAHTATVNAAAVLAAGRVIDLIVTTSGTTSYTLTFGTNLKSTGTLATGTTDAKKFVVRFISDGVEWIETSRTAAL